jgi:hypothetical protein
MEFRLLALLAQNAGDVMPRAALPRHVRYYGPKSGRERWTCMSAVRGQSSETIAVSASRLFSASGTVCSRVGLEPALQLSRPCDANGPWAGMLIGGGLSTIAHMR